MKFQLHNMKPELGYPESLKKLDVVPGVVHTCNMDRGTGAGKFLALWPPSLPNSMSFSVQWETMFQNIRSILIKENIQR